MRPYSPGGALHAFASAGSPSASPLPSAHRLRPGLPGYLIPFAPLAFASQRQKGSRASLSPRAFLPISTHFTAPPEVPGPPTPLLASTHRLRPGLPGYLIPFAPLAFVPQRQTRSSVSLSPPAFLPISTHFTAPPEVPHTPISLQLASLGRNSPVEPGAFTPYLTSRLRTL